MSFNIELKASCANIDLFERKVLKLSHAFDGIDNQTDTFFNVSKGRIKLRESTLYGNFLIPYLRPDNSGPKRSDYSLLPVSDVAATKRILDTMFGTLLIVRKVRKIYLHKNIRIHLDRVDGLGDFIEFEAVVEQEADIPENQATLDTLIRYFEIDKEDFIARAYADLLTEQ